MIHRLGWLIIMVMLGGLLVACGAQSQATPIPDEDQMTRAAEILRQDLRELYANWQIDPVQAKAAALEAGFLFDSEDRVLVSMALKDESYAESVSEGLAALNGEIDVTYRDLMDAWIPVPELVHAANLTGVAQMDKPIGLNSHE